MKDLIGMRLAEVLSLLNEEGGEVKVERIAGKFAAGGDELVIRSGIKDGMTVLITAPFNLEPLTKKGNN